MSVRGEKMKNGEREVNYNALHRAMDDRQKGLV